jgi:hypothetical protein
MHSLFKLIFTCSRISVFSLPNHGVFMKTFRYVVLLLACSPALILSACGDGWEVVEVRGQVPYTEERTAGPGVAYVRAHMMPEKSVVLPAPVTAPVQETAPPLQNAEPIFEQKVQKK